MPDDAAPRKEPKQFSQFLAEQRRGLLHAELSEQLAELVTACMTTRKAGSLTLSVKVKPTGDAHVEVTDDVVIKVPRDVRPPSIFFTDEHGTLHRNDPRQGKLPLREVVNPEEATQ